AHVLGAGGQARGPDAQGFGHQRRDVTLEDRPLRHHGSDDEPLEVGRPDPGHGVEAGLARLPHEVPEGRLAAAEAPHARSHQRSATHALVSVTPHGLRARKNVRPTSSARPSVGASYTSGTANPAATSADRTSLSE